MVGIFLCASLSLRLEDCEQAKRTQGSADLPLWPPPDVPLCGNNRNGRPLVRPLQWNGRIFIFGSSFFFSYLRCPSPDSRNERGKKEEEDEDEAEESPSSDGRRIEGPRSFGGFQNERRNISSDSGPLFIPCPSHRRLRKSSSRLAVGGSQGEYLFECLKKGPRKITPKRATPESRRSVG